MGRRATAVIAVVLGTAVCPALAGAAATGAKSHRVDSTIRIAIVAEPEEHTYTDAGAVTGLQGSGALIEHDVSTGSSFTGTGTTYYANGSVRSKTHAHQVTLPDGSTGDVGGGTFVGGTGAYRGASGSYRATVTPDPPAQPGAQTVATVHVVGTIRY